MQAASTRIGFLSTLSLRRATTIDGQSETGDPISIHALLAESDPATWRRRSAGIYFYPRSPCGERLLPFAWHLLFQKISIHALLAESDHDKYVIMEATKVISIHALLAESDHLCVCVIELIQNFYPRSPCGERRSRHVIKTRAKNFYPRSPCGERRGQLPTTQPPTMNFYPRSPCGERRPKQPKHQ